jgi:hypothetical protein
MFNLKSVAMKRVIIAISFISLITLCVNAQTNKDSLSPKTDTTSKTPDITVPEYQKYPFNPENTEPNTSPGITMPSINAPARTLPSNTPGNIDAPGTQIAPDTMKLPGINQSPVSPGLPAPSLPDNSNMSPTPANPALPSAPGIPDNQTPLPD